MNTGKILWDDKYSVGVEIIDDQHKMLFANINKLIDILREVPKKEHVDEVIAELVNYKKFHFLTEEKYFDEFGYDNTEDHKAKHKEFNIKLESLINRCGDDSITLAFGLVDFLEDWLLDHILVDDQKYVKCFASHGLK
jgi:hemerythrin-like metal-binding protein